MSRLVADVIVKFGYCSRVGRLKLYPQADVGVNLEVIVHCRIVGVAPLSEVEEQGEDFTGVAGEILKLL